MADKVLIIEDESKIVLTVRHYLEQSGYQLVTIQDGAQAIPAFRHKPSDLIILDLILPNLDGWEIHRQIPCESGTPISQLVAFLLIEPVDLLEKRVISLWGYKTASHCPKFDCTLDLKRKAKEMAENR